GGQTAPNVGRWQSTANLWGTGMTLIPFVLQGNNYILQYNPTNGNVGIDRLNADGSGTTATWRPTSPWKTGMTTLIPFVSQGNNYYILQYNPTDGTIVTGRLNADGSYTPLSITGATWGKGSTLIPFVSQGNTYLLKYNPIDGTVTMDQLYADGATMITAFWRPTDPWWTGMTTLIPFVSQGNNYILQYNHTDGT